MLGAASAPRRLATARVKAAHGENALQATNPNPPWFEGTLKKQVYSNSGQHFFQVLFRFYSLGFSSTAESYALGGWGSEGGLQGVPGLLRISPCVFVCCFWRGRGQTPSFRVDVCVWDAYLGSGKLFGLRACLGLGGGDFGAGMRAFQDCFNAKLTGSHRKSILEANQIQGVTSKMCLFAILRWIAPFGRLSRGIPSLRGIPHRRKARTGGAGSGSSRRKGPTKATTHVVVFV